MGESGKVTIVILPIISLIVDNYNRTKKYGIKCLKMHSPLDKDDENESDRENTVYRRELSDIESDKTKRMKDGYYKAIFICPEKLRETDDPNPNIFINILQHLFIKNRIDRFVIDEMHCMPNWGLSFRKSYLYCENIK